MRLVTTTIALAALLLTRAAGAAGTDKSSGKEFGKGASGPAAAPGGSSGGGSFGGGDDSRDRVELGAGPTTKAWDIGAGFEYHHMLSTQDVQNPVNENVNYWTLQGHYDFTPYDRVAAIGAVYEYFRSDQEETGARLDDLLLTYSRWIPLPSAFDLYVTPGYVAPTSRGSQLAGSIGEVRLTLEVARKFFRYLTLDARLRGSAFFFRSAVGGCGGYQDAGLGGAQCTSPGAMGSTNPNPLGGLAARLTAELSMPFHTPLVVGATAYDSFLWYRGIPNPGPSLGSDNGASSMGMVGTNPALTPGSQPAQQFYGYELYARYYFPSLRGFKFDLAFTFAPLGDTTLGYANATHGTGVPHYYGYFRENAEIYLSLNAHY